MILATSTVSTFVKYIFYVSDMLMEDYVRYRKITSNMNERFPDATSEELDVSNATCIICREEMATAKKLLDGHLFHVHCLREIGEQAEEEVPLRLLHGSFSSTGRILSTGTVPCCLPQCARVIVY
ncbi:ERAD-associated E3 ubiquitin-protein ligase HRD1A [Zea mays]|uniref:ERAD-associated E3 ubiquitin-protein ligase HRD1A n=1 Tax=Zea mays TaxID=4577 RepID=A0A1D6IWB5_MAIZE|nr:ERAD-associated E3 ubiquitin-protein ligase HRD1A [Zea mays]